MQTGTSNTHQESEECEGCKALRAELRRIVEQQRAMFHPREYGQPGEMDLAETYYGPWG
jgi:hypothetical protein